MFLYNTSKKPLISLCERILIQEHFPKMSEAFPLLLSNDRSEDLKRTFKLVQRISDEGKSLEAIRSQFEQFVTQYGIDQLKALAEQGGDDEKVVRPAVLQTFISKFFVNRIPKLNKKPFTASTKSIGLLWRVVSRMNLAFKRLWTRHVAPLLIETQ